MDDSKELDLSTSGDENKTILLDATLDEQASTNVNNMNNESSTESEEQDVNKLSANSIKTVDISDSIEPDNSDSNAATIASSENLLNDNSDEDKTKRNASSGDSDEVKSVSGDKTKQTPLTKTGSYNDIFDDTFYDDHQVEIVKHTKKSDDINEDDIEETVIERLVGLTEMFPDCVRNVSHSIIYGTCPMIKNTYKVTRTISWIFFSSMTILVLPFSLEKERCRSKQEFDRQMLLGGGQGAGGLGMAPAPVSK